MRLSVPISAGELVDKVTILLIKREKIVDPFKLIEINREIEALYPAMSVLPLSSEMEVQIMALSRVNMQLWALCQPGALVADDIDAAYVDAARGVPALNDQRAQIKRRINVLCGSALVEGAAGIS